MKSTFQVKLLCGAQGGGGGGGVHSFNTADYVAGIKPIQQRVAVGGTQAVPWKQCFSSLLFPYTQTLTFSPNTFAGCYREELSI